MPPGIRLQVVVKIEKTHKTKIMGVDVPIIPILHVIV